MIFIVIYIKTCFYKINQKTEKMNEENEKLEQSQKQDDDQEQIVIGVGGPAVAEIFDFPMSIGINNKEKKRLRRWATRKIHKLG